jgi:uncharacterized membrane protein YbhN (UPF0104 family)
MFRRIRNKRENHVLTKETAIPGPEAHGPTQSSPSASLRRSDAPSPTGNRVRLGVGLLIGVGALYAVVSAAGGFADSLDAVTSVKPAWLVAGAAAEVVSFIILGLLLHRLTGRRVDAITSVRLGLVVAGLGTVLPGAPAEGLIMANAELERRGVDTHHSRIALGLMQWYSTRALFEIAALDTLAVVTVASVRHPGHTDGREFLAAIALAALAILAMTTWLAGKRHTLELIAVIAGPLEFWTPTAPRATRRARGAAWHQEISEVVGSGASQLMLGAVAVGACLANAACFRYALIAVGIHLSIGMFLFVYAVAMISALVPLVPAGLGVVETIVPALLHRTGVPLPTALAGILVYRALGTLLPAIAGAIAVIQLRLASVSHLVPDAEVSV